MKRARSAGAGTRDESVLIETFRVELPSMKATKSGATGTSAGGNANPSRRTHPNTAVPNVATMGAPARSIQRPANRSATNATAPPAMYSVPSCARG